MEKDKTNSKKAFRILKELTGTRSKRTDVTNDTEGRALTESVDILKKYCGKLYKSQDGDTENNRLDQRSDYVREPPPLRSWTKGEWPKDWCRVVFIPLPKKGNPKECSNYRTISLVVYVSNVLLKIIKGRIKLDYDR